MPEADSSRQPTPVAIVLEFEDGHRTRVTLPPGCSVRVTREELPPKHPERHLKLIR